MKFSLSSPFILALGLFACSEAEVKQTVDPGQITEFQYKADRFADIQLLRYQVPGFEQLTLQQKKLAYYLTQAALSGRDIIWDQNYKHNLRIRRTIEAIIKSYSKNRDSQDFLNFLTWAKRVWFSNGIHHHYSTAKMIPEISPEYFQELVANSTSELLPLMTPEIPTDLIDRLSPIIFEPTIDPKRINLDTGADNVKESANNYYESVTQAEVEAYYKKVVNPDEPHKISYGLNSKMLKKDGEVVEETYKVGGLYGEALKRMVYWLRQAAELAETNEQEQSISLLADYFESGDLKRFDEYNIAWVKDTAATVDAIIGFIEVYGDALGYRGAYEAVVSIKDMEATRLMAALSENIQWFEENSPIMEEHKKKEAKGISYKVITVINEAGSAAPSTPVGINLPNANWIRKEHGSKSVSLGNITESYGKASSGRTFEEFGADQEVVERAREFGDEGRKLHTSLHEVIGHASGQLEPGVGEPSSTLKNYRSPMEEARADLVSLYFLMDPKLVELGVMSSQEIGKLQYDVAILNGLMLQLRRIEEGDNIEQAHMRNRQMVAAWAYQQAKEDNTIQRINRDGKTYFKINDYQRLREIFGTMLREVQRIKSQGDYEAARDLIEGYGVKVDQEILKEVKVRYADLDTAPYSGFIQPKLIPVMNGEEITDIRIEYPTDFVEQMMEYGRNYSFLPHYN